MPAGDIAHDDYLEIFTDMELKPRILYPVEGLKHGMKLAAISGVNGVFSDEDIAAVREKALEARKSWKPSTPAKPPRKRAVGKKKLARKKT